MRDLVLSLDAETFLDGLIGRPYAPGRDGPDRFDCYGLLFFIDQHLGVDALPRVVRSMDRGLAAEEVAAALKAAPVRGRWRKVPVASVWDIAVMGNVDGREHHLGRCVRNKGQFSIIHADDRTGVVFDDIPALAVKGFNRLTFYRPVESDGPFNRTRASRP